MIAPDLGLERNMTTYVLREAGEANVLGEHNDIFTLALDASQNIIYDLEFR